MASNTKLTAEQKQELKAMRATERGVYIGRDFTGRATVALVRTGRYMGEFSASIASPDEKKIRPKVGEFNARLRLYGHKCIPVELPEDMSEEDMQEQADYLASTLA